MSTCVFCKIVNSEIPADIVHRDELVTAFRDSNPQAPTHILIVPNRHIRSLNELQAGNETLIGEVLYKSDDFHLHKEEYMPQAGFHGMAGAAARKWMPKREWLLLGVVLGNMFPDLDNVAVAVATVAKGSTAGLDRTFTHSLFTIAALVILFYLVAAVTKKPKWNNLGLG